MTLVYTHYQMSFNYTHYKMTLVYTHYKMTLVYAHYRMTLVYTHYKITHFDNTCLLVRCHLSAHTKMMTRVYTYCIRLLICCTFV
jgi:ribosomal protein L6P/L9E